jgi:type I restriction enzyme R subunit
MFRISENFAFLSHTDERLARLGALAEWSLQVDPPTTIQKLRIFTEVLARFVAARQGMLSVPDETFADLLTRLRRTRLLPDKAAEVCHHLRRLGNVAIHENRGTAAQALLCLKLARELGIWLYRTFTPDPAFFSRSFRTPELPSDISAELAAQAEALRAKVAASETAAAIADLR